MSIFLNNNGTLQLIWIASKIFILGLSSTEKHSHLLSVILESNGGETVKLENGDTKCYKDGKPCPIPKQNGGNPKITNDYRKKYLNYKIRLDVSYRELVFVVIFQYQK